MSLQDELKATESATGRFVPWQAGVLGGLAGSFVMGLLMAFVNPAPVLEVAIPNMYGIQATPGEPAALIGWIIHMAHGAVLGVGFAALLRIDPVERVASSLVGTGLFGVVWGLITWVGLGVVLMPVWLSAVGFPGAPPLPNIGVMGLVAHVVYGVVLAVVYEMLV